MTDLKSEPSMSVDPKPQAFLNHLIETLYERAFANNAIDRSTIFDRKEDVSVILGAPEVYTKDFALIGLLGSSRFNTNGETWRKRRDLSQPAYVASVREPLTGRVIEIFDEVFDAIDEPTATSINAACALASMRVFLNALGCQGDATRFVAFLEPLRLLLIDLQYASLRSVSMSERDVLAERSRDAGAQFARLLRDGEDTHALLERFTALLGDGNESDAAEEILMNMFAGVETTTAVLGWIVDRLGVNPRVQDRLYLEMRDTDDVKTYRQCFIHETLRYFPPIPFVIRSVADQTDLNGEILDRGKQILVSIVGLHHDPRVWSSPQTFDAARPEFLEDSFERSSFIPFLQGPRTCGGIRLAGLEIAAGLDQLLKRFIITNPDAAIAFDYALAMRPQPSPTMTIERR